MRRARVCSDSCTIRPYNPYKYRKNCRTVPYMALRTTLRLRLRSGYMPYSTVFFTAVTVYGYGADPY